MATIALAAPWVASTADGVPAAPDREHAAEEPLPAGSPLLGVNVDLVALDDSALADTVDRLAAAGVPVVRQPVRWADLEPVRAHRDWVALDRVVAALAEREIALVATLRSTPAWARHDPPPEAQLFLCADPAATDPRDADEAPPTDTADLAAFAEDLARRYAGRLWAVEVWSEPNLLPNWRRGGPDPEDYGAVLAETAAALRRGDDEVLVVSAALAPTTDIGVCYLSDVVFLDRVARTGALASVDAVGIEPFGLREGADATAETIDPLNFARAEVLHDTLVAQGIARPLWALAWGWNGLPAGWRGRPSPWGSHSEATSARLLGLGYARARASWPWMGPMFVWLDRPDAAPDDPVWGFALVRPDERPTERWATVTALLRGELPAPPEIPDGRPQLPPSAGVLAAAALACAVLAGCGRRWIAPPLARLLTWLSALSTPVGVAALATLALANAALPWPIGSVALVGMTLLGAAMPGLAVAAVATAAPFNSALPMYLGRTPIWPVELLTAVAVAGRILTAYAAGPGCAGDRQTRPRWHVLDVTVLALVVWSAASVLWAEHPDPALREWRTVIVEPAVVYALLRTLPDRRRGALAAMLGLVVGGVVAASWALVGLARFAVGHAGAAVAAEGVVRANGPYRSPNNLALFVGRLLPVVGSFVLLGGRRRRRIWLVTGAGLALALLATFSRGAVLLGVPATVAFLGVVTADRWRRRFSRRRVLVVGAVAAAFAVLVAVPFARTERLRETFELEPGSTLFIRWRLWESAVEMGLDHPVLGVGLDNFLYLYRDRYVRRDAVEERFLSHPHNVVLDWWTRLGVPGLVILAVLVVGSFRAGLRALARDAPDRTLAVAALGMLVYGLAHGLVDNAFFLVDLALAWWIAQATVLALVDDGRRAAGVCSDRPAPTRPDPTQPKRVRVGPPGFEPGTDRL